MKITDAPDQKKFLTSRDLATEGYQNIRGLKVGECYQIPAMPDWKLRRAGYQLSPSDLEAGVREELGFSHLGTQHPRFSSVKGQKATDLFGSGWQYRPRTRDAVVKALAYVEAASKGFGGGARGLWMEETRFIQRGSDRVFKVLALKSHVLGFRLVDPESGPYLNGPTRVTFAQCEDSDLGWFGWFRTGDLKDARPLAT